MKALLLIQDAQEESILRHALELANLSVDSEQQLPEAATKWIEHPADLVVIGLELADPLNLVHEFRQVAIAPLILVMDPITERTHIKIIDAGADWVVERPYSLPLFISYTRVLMRRAGSIMRESLPTVRHQQVKLDPSRRTVTVGSRPSQRLSQLEFRLLHTLMMHRGQVLPTETIVEHVWGYTGEGDRKLVRGLINRLRVKIEINPNNPHYIQTVSRVGYTFNTDDT